MDFSTPLAFIDGWQGFTLERIVPRKRGQKDYDVLLRRGEEYRKATLLDGTLFLGGALACREHFDPTADPDEWPVLHDRIDRMCGEIYAYFLYGWPEYPSGLTFIALDDSVKFRFGFRCVETGKEWWINISSVKSYEKEDSTYGPWMRTPALRKQLAKRLGDIDWDGEFDPDPEGQGE